MTQIHTVERLLIDATGKVVSIRDYGDETRIRVPKDGFVVSQHAEAGGFCWAVQIGNYVGVDYTSSKAYLYTSVDGYLLNHKTVAVGGQYGVLPTPKRETYTFDGWYTAASGGTKITAGSTYSVDKLYAHWTSNDPCASGHSWNSGTVTTAATCEKAGIKTYTCTVCKTTKTETIAALGHSYKETKIAGSCTQRPAQNMTARAAETATQHGTKPVGRRGQRRSRRVTPGAISNLRRSTDTETKTPQRAAAQV